MKVLTLTQPWATLVAIGAKRIETRSWGTSYRGPLAIHAAKTFPSWAKDFAIDDPVCSKLLRELGLLYPSEDWGFRLPLGKVIATTELRYCERSELVNMVLPEYGAPEERRFGDYSPGRFLWVLGDVQALPEPIAARGSLGLWEWSPPDGFPLR